MSDDRRAVRVFKSRTKLREEAEKKERAKILAEDRRILGEGVRSISLGEARDAWKAAFTDQHIDGILASDLAKDIEWCATAACNAGGKLPREEAREFDRKWSLLEEVEKSFPSVVLEDLKSKMRHTASHPKAAGAFQREARADGPHKVFAFHHYRAVKRIGWELKLERDVTTGKFDPPFVPFAVKAWSLCFPGVSKMPERTVEQVMREQGAVQLQPLPENSQRAQ